MSDPGDIPVGRYAAINLVAALSSARDLPAEALELALLSPARIAGPVLEVVRRAADGAILSERDANLLFWGIHVLGAARTGALHIPLLRLARRPSEEVEQLLGPAIAATLPRLAAGSFEGDAGALETAMFDPDADEYVRWSLFGAYAFLVAEGRIARERCRDLLARFDAERAARAGSAAWTGWEQAIALLGFGELAPAVAAARADARLLDDVSDPEWFVATLADAQANPGDRARFEELELGYVENIVPELEDALAPDEEEPEERVAPARNPLREIGRNDPCPCGSGRKFKACCLAA